MMRGIVIALMLLAFVACVGLVAAQEQKEEGIMGKVKKVLPGGDKKACTKKEGPGMMEKVKEALPGGKEKAATKEERTGMMEKMKKLLPGGEKKA
ncbi:MAG: hypothetical protein P8123_07190, partial [bacterium]